MCFANQVGTNDAYDMSGNVKEWTLARTPGQNPLRGGASNNVVTGLTLQPELHARERHVLLPERRLPLL